MDLAVAASHTPLMVRILRVLIALLISGSVALIGSDLVGWIGTALLSGANHESWKSLLIFLFECVAFILIVPPVYALVGRVSVRT